jgi:short-subunit dehydrogenase
MPPVWSSGAGQVELVTGGSAGLGLWIATALAAGGSDVVLASRSADHCQQAAAALSAQTGRRVTGRGCDVTDEAAGVGRTQIPWCTALK